MSDMSRDEGQVWGNFLGLWCFAAKGAIISGLVDKKNKAGQMFLAELFQMVDNWVSSCVVDDKQNDAEKQTRNCLSRPERR
jgi:hypothetical protein